MDIQVTFMSLIHNKHWRRIQMCLMFVILAAQATYSYAVPQTFSGSTLKIETKYDRGKNETTVATKTMLEESSIETLRGPVREFTSLILAYAHKGLRLNSPPSVVTLVFQSQARQHRFGEERELLSIIDGERLALGQMSYSGDTSNPLVELFLLTLRAVQDEYLRIDVPLNTFLKLARARTAILIIGNKELTLREQHFNVLSAFANHMTGKAVASTTSSGAETANSTPIGKCPIQTSNPLALRGFKLGMSVQEVSSLLQGSAPPLSEPDSEGVRSMEVRFSRSQNAPGSTNLDQLEFKFFDERVYIIKANYSVYCVGREGMARLGDFPDFISQELGVSATWKEPRPTYAYSRQLALECGAAYINLNVEAEEKAFKGALFGSRGPWMGRAILIMSDTDAEGQLQSRNEKYLRK